MRISAVLVGLANAAVFALTTDRPLDATRSRTSSGESCRRGGAPGVGGRPQARLRGLRGEFYARHLTIVLAVCVGGMLLGSLLISVSVLADGATTVADRVPGVRVMAPIAGFAEGLFLGGPLAALLGMVGERSIRR